MIRYIVLRYTDKPDSLRDLTAKSNHKYQKTKSENTDYFLSFTWEY